MAVSQTLKVTESSYNENGNTSWIKILWTSTQTGESFNDFEKNAKFYISVNGEKETEHSVAYTLPKNSTVTIVDRGFQIGHRDDGTGEVEVWTWMNTGISAGIVEKDCFLKLTTIPRASTITSLKASNLGSYCSVAWTPFASSFTYRLNFTLGDWSYTTGVISPNRTNTTYAYSYTLPLEVANQMPNSTEGTMTVTLATYKDKAGLVQVGSNSTKTIQVTVPMNISTQPTVSSMSVAPLHDLPSTYNDVYLQGHSKVKATLGFETKYGASVGASSITVDGNTYDSPYESGILYKAGKVSVKATVKDSRGFYGTNYKEIDVIPYSKPYVSAKSNESSVIAARCNASAEFTDSGTYLKIKAKAAYSKVISNGVQHNYGNIKFRYCKEGGAYSSWQTILNGKTDNSDEVITPPLLNGALDVRYNYQVQIVAYDDLYESDPITIAIPSEEVYMDRPAGGKSMGLGGYSSGGGNLDIYWRAMARGGLSLFNAKGDEIPLDSTMPIPSNQVSEGWNPDDMPCGVHVVAKNYALKQGDTVIMYNGVLLQMNGDVDGNVKLQLALPVDENRNPMYRLCWYSTWSNWRSMKL